MYAHRGSLPVGVVALRAARVCGVAALKADSIPSHAHLAPWAAAGFVHPSLRGQGIGRGLLQRSGWQWMEDVVHDAEVLGVYCKGFFGSTQ